MIWGQTRTLGIREQKEEEEHLLCQPQRSGDVPLCVKLFNIIIWSVASSSSSSSSLGKRWSSSLLNSIQLRAHVCVSCQAVFSKPIALTHHWLRWTCASPISDLWGSRGSLNFFPPLIWSLKGCYNNIFHVEIVAAGIMWRKKHFPPSKNSTAKRNKSEEKANKDQGRQEETS